MATDTTEKATRVSSFFVKTGLSRVIRICFAAVLGTCGRNKALLCYLFVTFCLQ